MAHFTSLFQQNSSQRPTNIVNLSNAWNGLYLFSLAFLFHSCVLCSVWGLVTGRKQFLNSVIKKHKLLTENGGSSLYWLGEQIPLYISWLLSYFDLSLTFYDFYFFMIPSSSLLDYILYFVLVLLLLRFILLARISRLAAYALGLYHWSEPMAT